MVGRGDHNVGLLAAALDMISGVGDAGCCIASSWLAEHLIGLQHGQMLKYQMLICLVGHHEEILIGDDWTKPFIGTTDKALSST